MTWLQTARIYIDEDSMDRALEAHGVDVLTALEAGMIERYDVDHLLYSTQEERILLTCNVGDFCRLHSEFLEAQRPHAGIICMTQTGGLDPCGDFCGS